MCRGPGQVCYVHIRFSPSIDPFSWFNTTVPLPLSDRCPCYSSLSLCHHLWHHCSMRSISSSFPSYRPSPPPLLVHLTPGAPSPIPRFSLYAPKGDMVSSIYGATLTVAKFRFPDLFPPGVQSSFSCP